MVNARLNNKGTGTTKDGRNWFRAEFSCKTVSKEGGRVSKTFFLTPEMYAKLTAINVDDEVVIDIGFDDRGNPVPINITTPILINNDFSDISD